MGAGVLHLFVSVAHMFVASLLGLVYISLHIHPVLPFGVGLICTSSYFFQVLLFEVGAMLIHRNMYFACGRIGAGAVFGARLHDVVVCATRSDAAMVGCSSYACFFFRRLRLQVDNLAL